MIGHFWDVPQRHKDTDYQSAAIQTSAGNTLMYFETEHFSLSCWIFVHQKEDTLQKAQIQILELPHKYRCTTWREQKKINIIHECLYAATCQLWQVTCMNKLNPSLVSRRSFPSYKSIQIKKKNNNNTNFQGGHFAFSSVHATREGDARHKSILPFGGSFTQRERKGEGKTRDRRNGVGAQVCSSTDGRLICEQREEFRVHVWN